MEKNIIKIKSWTFFVMMGLVTLGNFNTAFCYQRTIDNNTPYQVAGTIKFLGGPACPDTTFSIDPGRSFGTNSAGCLVDKIQVSVFKNWQGVQTSGGLASLASGIIKNAQDAINLTWTANAVTAGTVLSGVAEGLGLSPFIGQTSDNPSAKGSSAATAGAAGSTGINAALASATNAVSATQAVNAANAAAAPAITNAVNTATGSIFVKKAPALTPAPTPAAINPIKAANDKIVADAKAAFANSQKTVSVPAKPTPVPAPVTPATNATNAAKSTINSLFGKK